MFSALAFILEWDQVNGVNYEDFIEHILVQYTSYIKLNTIKISVGNLSIVINTQRCSTRHGVRKQTES